MVSSHYITQVTIYAHKNEYARKETVLHVSLTPSYPEEGDRQFPEIPENAGKYQENNFS